MKIRTLIKKLQRIEKKRGNCEVAIYDRPVNCNHQYYAEIDFGFYDSFLEDEDGDESEIVVLGIDGEEEDDYVTDEKEEDDYAEDEKEGYYYIKDEYLDR